MKVKTKSAIKANKAKSASPAKLDSKATKSQNAAVSAMKGKTGKTAVKAAVNALLRSPEPIRDAYKVAHTPEVKREAKPFGNAKLSVLMLTGSKGSLYRLAIDKGNNAFQLCQHDESGLRYDGPTVLVQDGKLEADREARRQSGAYVASKGETPKVSILTPKTALAACRSFTVHLRRSKEPQKLLVAGKPAFYNPAIEKRKDGSLWFTQAEFRTLPHNGSHHCSLVSAAE